MRKTLLLGIVLVSHAALAAEIDGVEQWQDESLRQPSAAYVDPRWPPPPPQHYHYHPTLPDSPPVERNAESLLLSVPRHARRGLSTTVAMRYRKVQGNVIVRLKLSPGLFVEYSNPPSVLGPDGELVWFDLAGPMGNLQVKARIDAAVPAGTALLIHADLIDGYGKAEQRTETIVVR